MRRDDGNDIPPVGPGEVIGALVWTVVIILGASWLTRACVADASERKAPQVMVSAYPRLGNAPLYVRATGRVVDPERELPCPSFEITWGELEGRSAWEPDCDPYEPPEDRPERWAFVPKGHRYYVPGEYEIGFSVTAGDRVLRANQRVIVKGDPLDAQGGTK